MNTIKFIYSKIIKNAFIKILIFIIILLATIFYLSKKNKHNSEKNIQMFEKIISNMEDKPKETLNLAKNFSKNTKNIYGILVNLTIAKHFIEINNLTKAEKILNDTIKIKMPNNIKNLIYIKLSRIQLELNKTKEACITLKKIEYKHWGAIIENIKGDIFKKNKNFKQAIQSYNKALNLNNIEILNKIIKYKINRINNQ